MTTNNVPVYMFWALEFLKGKVFRDSTKLCIINMFFCCILYTVKVIMFSDVVVVDVTMLQMFIKSTNIYK